MAEWTSSSPSRDSLRDRRAIAERRARTSASSDSERRPASPQALRVDGRGLAVVRQELVVVGAQKLPDRRVQVRAARPARPEGHARARARPRAAASSVSSAAMRMNPSAASCGKVSPVP